MENTMNRDTNSMKKITKTKTENTRDLKISSIGKAVSYFLDILNPAYDKCYKIMSDHDKERDSMSDDFSAVDAALLITNRMTEMLLELNEARDYLKTKQEEFELLKTGFDGFDLKDMDRQIKERIKL
jgi:hypothetical protein